MSSSWLCSPALGIPSQPGTRIPLFLPLPQSPLLVGSLIFSSPSLMSTAELQLIKDVNDAGERGRGRRWEGAGGGQLLAVCNSAVKCLLPQQKSYHGRQCQLYGGGRALSAPLSPPVIAAASLLCVSAADDVLPPKCCFVSWRCHTALGLSLPLAAILTVPGHPGACLLPCKEVCLSSCLQVLLHTRGLERIWNRSHSMKECLCCDTGRMLCGQEQAVMGTSAQHSAAEGPWLPLHQEHSSVGSSKSIWKRSGSPLPYFPAHCLHQWVVKVRLSQCCVSSIRPSNGGPHVLGSRAGNNGRQQRWWVLLLFPQIAVQYIPIFFLVIKPVPRR